MTARKERKRTASAPASVARRSQLLEWLKDAENAAAYVDAAPDEGDPAGLLQALRNVAEWRGGVSRIAQKTGLNREALYRTLSKGRQSAIAQPCGYSWCNGAAAERTAFGSEGEKSCLMRIRKETLLHPESEGD